MRVLYVTVPRGVAHVMFSKIHDSGRVTASIPANLGFFSSTIRKMTSVRPIVLICHLKSMVVVVETSRDRIDRITVHARGVKCFFLVCGYVEERREVKHILHTQQNQNQKDIHMLARAIV